MRLQYEGFYLYALTRGVLLPASKRCTIIFNPKSACSTLKFNIWKQEYETGTAESPPPTKGGGVHRKKDTPIPKIPVEELESALFDRPVFSLVRNPYARILSSYLQKIATGRKQKRHLLLGMGRRNSESVTFSEFVDFISRQNSREMDRHYAPQAFLMQINYVPFTKIGCVERIDESISAITALAYGSAPTAIGEYRHHRTDAPQHFAEYYTEEVAAKVLNRFRVDFDIFGYSTELSEANLPPRNLDGAAEIGRGASESILRPIIRAAVAEKRGDISEALQLLSSVTSDEPELDVTRARLLIELGRQREALALLQGVVARVDNVGKYWMQLAECPNNKEAAEAADKAVAVAPYLGVLQRALRTWKKAGETEKVEDCKNKIASIMETSPKKRKGKRLPPVGANGHIHPKQTAAARRRAHSLAR